MYKEKDEQLLNTVRKGQIPLKLGYIPIEKLDTFCGIGIGK